MLSHEACTLSSLYRKLNPKTLEPNPSPKTSTSKQFKALIVPLKEIEYGFGYFYSEIPIYPLFYLLKGDYNPRPPKPSSGADGMQKKPPLLGSKRPALGSAVLV